MYCVTALAVQGKTAAAGATAVNALVDVSAFYREHVLPELTTEDVNVRPVLKADALRSARGHSHATELCM
jgi:exportin-2 (importin alpha re-exporter)